MKRLGLILLFIGIAITLFAGFQFITRENVMEVGDLRITQNQIHTADWSPTIGIGVMLVGGLILLLGSKKI